MKTTISFKDQLQRKTRSTRSKEKTQKYTKDTYLLRSLPNRSPPHPPPVQEGPEEIIESNVLEDREELVVGEEEEEQEEQVLNPVIDEDTLTPPSSTDCRSRVYNRLVSQVDKLHRTHEDCIQKMETFSDIEGINKPLFKETLNALHEAFEKIGMIVSSHLLMFQNLGQPVSDTTLEDDNQDPHDSHMRYKRKKLKCINQSLSLPLFLC